LGQLAIDTGDEGSPLLLVEELLTTPGREVEKALFEVLSVDEGDLISSGGFVWKHSSIWRVTCSVCLSPRYGC